MKKLTGAIVATAALVSLTVTGCKGKDGASAKGGSGKDTYMGVKAQKDPSTKKIYDFGGLEVTIYDWWSNPDAEPSTKQQEDQANYRKWLEDTYNFKAKQSDLAGWAEYPAEVANYCITGGDDARVFIIDGRSAFSGLKANLWADLSKVPGIDWTAAKWNKAAINVMKSGDSFYSFAYGKPEPCTAMFFNKRILQENGFDPEEPYNLQKAGKWTWDTFEDMCKKLTKDTDNDGIIDQYAMCSWNSIFSWASLASNGANVVVGKDANGKYYIDNSDAEIEAWNWVRKMGTTYQKPQPEGANWDYMKAEFKDGNVAFYVNEEYDAQPNGLLADMKDDWGMVTFPLGPRSNGKYFSLNADNMFVIPSCYSQDKINKIMKIVDLWTDDVPGYTDEDAWKEGYYPAFRDSRAVDETIQYMMDNPVAHYDWLIPGLDIGPYSWDIFAGADVSTTLENKKNETQALLDQMNN